MYTNIWTLANAPAYSCKLSVHIYIYTPTYEYIYGGVSFVSAKAGRVVWPGPAWYSCRLDTLKVLISASRSARFGCSWRCVAHMALLKNRYLFFCLFHPPISYIGHRIFLWLLHQCFYVTASRVSVCRDLLELGSSGSYRGLCVPGLVRTGLSPYRALCVPGLVCTGVLACWGLCVLDCVS